MNRQTLTTAIIEHVNHCYHEVCEIDNYVKQNVLNDQQRKYAAARRAKAMQTYKSARFILETMGEWREAEERQRWNRVAKLLEETRGDLYQRFLEYKAKQNENN
jgi:translation initiation factor 2 alpha subunit (eIF-2alpha)